jgi:acyl-[acyl-carrier-protein]-phospholipid O-acyltransferase/long-chain-fatty-acid--[acyl-carrier-protein] ligase
MEKIVKRSNFPVIPAYIGGAWGSIFSYKYRRLLSRLPVRIPYPVTIIFDKPLPSTTTAEDAEQAVALLSVEYFNSLKSKERTLQRMFIKIARNNWFKECISDSTGKRLTYGKLLTASLALANAIKLDVKNGRMVGIALPPSAGGVVCNLAVLLCGKIPVNINFTTSAEAIDSAIKQCGINMIISSRAFIEKVPSFHPSVRMIFVEDVVSGISSGMKLKALLKAIVVPVCLLTDKSTTSDSVATVIFSSGTTGEPKGVMLTHHNIISNLESFGGVFSFTKQDKIFGILPFFHSFGFTCTLWCPLLQEVKVCYHSNPLEAEKIGKLVKSEKATIIMTTPTFLLSYIRKIPADEFSSLRTVIVGAEKLRKNIADAFEEKFKMRPLEGYGTTELSPVVSVNLPDVEINNVKQLCHKEGSVGHPIPGVVAKIVDPDTMEQLPTGEEGLLLVKGPNLMSGYLNKPELTAAVLHNGWYNTGDIARIDSDGFIYILDRLSRYSKIAGEMIPHIAIEEKFYSLLNITGQELAVTSVPDEKKGEQLVVVYTPSAGTAEQLYNAISSSDLPNLWKPKKENYFMVETLPALGSGKLDFKRLKEIALAFVQNRQNPDISLK